MQSCNEKRLAQELEQVREQGMYDEVEYQRMLKGYSCIPLVTFPLHPYLASCCPHPSSFPKENKSTCLILQSCYPVPCLCPCCLCLCRCLC